MNNNDYKYTDEDGVSWHDYREYVFMKLLGFCDCRDEKLYKDIFTVLEMYRNAAKKGASVYYDKLLVGNPARYVELILHCLTSTLAILELSSYRLGKGGQVLPGTSVKFGGNVDLTK